MADGDLDRHTIAQKSREVRQGLVSLIDAFQDERTLRTVSVADITDALERFLLWAGNLGAMREPISKLSLDHRLSDAPDIRNAISRQLDDLTEAIDDLTGIVRGDQPNRDVTVDVDSDSDSIEHLEAHDGPSDEAHATLELILESLKSLFRIGVLLRKTGPSDRFDRALRSSSLVFPAMFDVDYVREKHTKLKTQEKNWLAERLGKAIAKRRQYIKYCRDHKKRLVGDDGQEGAGTATVLQSSKATTLHPDRLPSDLTAGADDEEDDAASFMSAYTTTDALSTLKLPHLADLSEGDRPFECPICFTLQSMKREATWRMHAFRDLKPYACTIGGTECESELFGERDAWFKHKLDHHRSQHTCPLCDHDLFSSRSDLRSHITDAHGRFPENQLQALEDAGRRPPVGFRAQDCPFCDDWAAALRSKAASRSSGVEIQEALVSLRRFKRHVAAHQEQLAIFAVPRATDEDDGAEAESAASLASTIPSASEAQADDEQPADKDSPVGEVQTTADGLHASNLDQGDAQYEPYDPSLDEEELQSLVKEGEQSIERYLATQREAQEKDMPVPGASDKEASDQLPQNIHRPQSAAAEPPTMPSKAGSAFRTGWFAGLPRNERVQTGIPSVTDDDFTYITAEDLEAVSNAPRLNLDAPEDEIPDDDILLIKYRGLTYRTSFPAFSIGDGRLLVGDVRRRVGIELGLSDRQCQLAKMLYKGKLVTGDDMPVRLHGVKNHSAIMVVLAEPRDAVDGDEIGQADEETAKEERPVQGEGERAGAKQEQPRHDVPPIDASSTPQDGPIAQLERIYFHFHGELMPRCVQFNEAPPPDPKTREKEHRTLSDAIMQEVLVKLDNVSVVRDDEARLFRRTMVREVHDTLNSLDRTKGT